MCSKNKAPITKEGQWFTVTRHLFFLLKALILETNFEKRRLSEKNEWGIKYKSIITVIFHLKSLHSRWLKTLHLLLSTCSHLVYRCFSKWVRWVNHQSPTRLDLISMVKENFKKKGREMHNGNTVKSRDSLLSFPLTHLSSCCCLTPCSPGEDRY